MFFSFFSECETMVQTVRWQKKNPALAFFDAKMIYHKEGIQTQIYLHPENTFFSFYGK